MLRKSDSFNSFPISVQRKNQKILWINLKIKSLLSNSLGKHKTTYNRFAEIH